MEPPSYRSILRLCLLLRVAALCWLALCFPSPCNAIIPKATASISARPVSLCGRTYPYHSQYSATSVGLFAKKPDDDDQDEKTKKIKKPQQRGNLSEEEISMMGNQRSLYNTFDAIITTGGILFILVGCALNLVGLDYVVKDGRVTIGTTEDRQFQKEMVTKKTTTRSNKYDPKKNMLQMQPRQSQEELSSPSITALTEEK